MLMTTLTSKGQTTIPVEIRQALHLKAGDKLVFEIHDDQAVISKAKPFDYLYHAAISQPLTE